MARTKDVLAPSSTTPTQSSTTLATVAIEPATDAVADAPSRLGVTVTRKVGTAVRRNRIKRLVREVFRLWPDLVPHGVDLLVIAKDGAHELDYARVRDEIAGVRGLLLKRVRDLDRPLSARRGPDRASDAQVAAGRAQRGRR